MTKAQERALEMYPEPEFDGYFDDLYVTRQGQAAWNRRLTERKRTRFRQPRPFLL